MGVRLFVAPLDPSVDALGEDQELGADERGRQARGDEDRDHLRHEGQRHFLNLGQRLQERDDHADRHRRADARAGADHHHPDRRLDKIDRVALAHCTLAPLASETVAPLARVATAPVLVTLTEATWPDVAPSDEVIVWPTSCSACESEVAVKSDESVVLVCTDWPTSETVASCDTIWDGSIGWVGSWFFISAIRRVRKSL